MDVKEPDKQTQDLMILNDMAYIIECVALDYSREARNEIDLLIANLEKVAPDSSGICIKLEQAKNCISNRQIRTAAGILSGVSRSFWDKMLGPLMP